MELGSTLGLADDGFPGEVSSPRSIGVGGVTVVIGASSDERGGVFGTVLRDGRFLLLDRASGIIVFTPDGVVGATGAATTLSATLEDLREDMLPIRSLLKSEPSEVPGPDRPDLRSGLPFCVLFLREPGLNASFSLKPGETLRDTDLPDPSESTE